MQIYMKLGRDEKGKLTILVYPGEGIAVDKVNFAIINNLKEEFDFGTDPDLPAEHAALRRHATTPPEKMQ